MNRVFVILTVVVLGCLMNGCVTVQDINPFTPRPLQAAEVSQSQFPHIFVPSALSRQTQRSFVRQGSTLSGCDAYTGNYDLGALGRFMQQSLLREGWKLQSSVMHNDRALQVYTREGVRAVLVVTRQTTSTLMEIWVGSPSTCMEWPVSANNAGATTAGTTEPNAPVYEEVPNASPSVPPAGASPSRSGLKERALP